MQSVNHGMSRFLYLFLYPLVDASKARNAVPEIPAATDRNLDRKSLSALCLKHAQVLHQREAELADTQAREVSAHANADALL